MTKYREYFERMITNEKETFDSFTKLHMQYSLDQDGMQEEFNSKGAKVVAVIREWENKLCSTSDKAGYGGYTSNLSEKFWQEVRKVYPLIDHVGIIVKKKPDTASKAPMDNNAIRDNGFVINKISFN